MFYCLDCGEAFTKPITLSEEMGEAWNAPTWDYYGACPYCHSDQIDIMDRCDTCGEYIKEGSLCEACSIKVNRLASELSKKAKEMKNRGLKIRELAEVLKVSNWRMYNLLSKRSTFTKLEREALAEFFGINEEELFKEKEA